MRYRDVMVGFYLSIYLIVMLKVKMGILVKISEMNYVYVYFFMILYGIE